MQGQPALHFVFFVFKNRLSVVKRTGGLINRGQ